MVHLKLHLLYRYHLFSPLKFISVSKYGMTSLSNPYIPNVASLNSPVFIKLSIISFIKFIGTANPIPSADVIFIVFIATTLPSMSINGPPLLPGFIVASVLYEIF